MTQRVTLPMMYGGDSADVIQDALFAIDCDSVVQYTEFCRVSLVQTVPVLEFRLTLKS